MHATTAPHPPAPAAATPLRIGVLGAARIAPMALLRPARRIAEVEVVALAARDPAKARRFAARHGVPRVLDSYQALLDDPDVDALYNPLPNGLHCEWTIRALRAGKHVLCEKPIAANAEEAEQMAAAARETGRILVEAFHWRYHPLAGRMRAVIAGGELGRLRHLEAWLCFPMLFPNDIRWRWDLAGGSLMDTGCYTISMLRHLASADPEVPASEPEVTSARAWLRSPQVDRRLEAELRWPDGRTGRIVCGLLTGTIVRTSLRATGDAGEMRVLNPLAPHFGNWLRVRGARGRRSERVRGASSYTHQLRAFAAAILHGASLPTGPDDAVANMRVVDAAYRAAGLRPRST
ncbi:MAG TPA: Gfo/Idh/MocA family oxidoreductase [Myxococcota bacterium]|nr:Gfo/Idh/MocA family oxidoreductase [Myxococcota bacterium]